MPLGRREFLKLLGVTAGAAGLGACAREWAVPDHLIQMALRGPGLETWKDSICRLCEGGCGITVRLVDDVPVGIKGNKRHPLNRGGLCPVGNAGLEVLYAAERLQSPMRRADQAHVPTTWDEALAEIAARLSERRGSGNATRIAVMTGEPSALFHELTERFVHALGSPNIVRTNAPLITAHTLTQGVQESPGFDLSGTDLVLTFGLDLFEDGAAPVHAISALIGSRDGEERASLIHVGTRLSPTAAKADEHVPVLPGTHAALALGIAHVLVREANYDREFVAKHTFGFEDWTDQTGRRRLGFRNLLLERYYPDRAAQLCGCDPARIIHLARRFAAARAPLAVAGGEATWGSNGTSTVMAVQALNALMGVFDRPGGVVLPPRVAFMPLASLPEPIPGEDASIFAARDTEGLAVDPMAAFASRVVDGSYPIDVLFVINSNPLYASPLSERLRRALDRIPLVVALSSFRDETAALADFILPTHVFLESWHETTTPPGVPFSVIGLGQPVVEPLHDTRHAGEVLLQLSRRVGGALADALPWESYVDYLKHRFEGLLISGQGSIISGSFEESWAQFLEERGWRFLEHNDLERFWTDLAQASGWWNPVGVRADWARLFQTPSGRYEFFSQELEQRLRRLGARGPGTTTDDETALQRGVASLRLSVEGDEACLPHFEAPNAVGKGDLSLVPFRTMTSRGDLAVNSPMLLEMFGYPVLSGWETWVEIAPDTAHHLDLEDGDLVAVESDVSTFEAVVKIQAGAVPDVVHVPLGLGHEAHGASAKVIGANPIRTLTPDIDPLSGAACLASTRVHLRLVRRRQHGGPAPAHGGHI